MNYKSLLKELTKYRKERGWDNQAPADLAKSIVMEAAELLEHFQWDETTRIKEGREQTLQHKNMSKIADEVGDIMIYLLEFCQDVGIDAVEATIHKLEKVKEKYPAHKITDKKHKGFYKKQKQKYRKRADQHNNPRQM